eukprot:4917386-Alexandrium_andersonii.AAC.1
MQRACRFNTLRCKAKKPFRCPGELPEGVASERESRVFSRPLRRPGAGRAPLRCRCSQCGRQARAH